MQSDLGKSRLHVELRKYLSLPEMVESLVRSRSGNIITLSNSIQSSVVYNSLGSSMHLFGKNCVNHTAIFCRGSFLWPNSSQYIPSLLPARQALVDIVFGTEVSLAHRFLFDDQLLSAVVVQLEDL